MIHKISLILAATMLASCTVAHKTTTSLHKTATEVATITVVDTMHRATATVLRDTTDIYRVTTAETVADTSIHLPATTIAGAGALGDGAIHLPDGSSFTWLVDSLRHTISLTASTPAKDIPVSIRAKTKIVDSGRTVNASTKHTESQQEAKTTAASTYTATETVAEKSKEKTTTIPSGLGIVVPLACVVLLCYLIYKNSRP